MISTLSSFSSWICDLNSLLFQASASLNFREKERTRKPGAWTFQTLEDKKWIWRSQSRMHFVSANLWRWLQNRIFLRRYFKSNSSVSTGEMHRMKCIVVRLSHQRLDHKADPSITANACSTTQACFDSSGAFIILFGFISLNSSLWNSTALRLLMKFMNVVY